MIWHMPVVSNTSPILNLAAVGYLHLLKAQFREVIVPQAVIEELKLESDHAGNDAVKKALDDGWLQVCPVKDINTVRVLQRVLDRGESEAISLALESDGELVLLDEKDARDVAKDMELATVGILGIILKAYFHGEIDWPLNVIKRLQKEAGFFLSAKIMKQIKAEVQRLST
ncbi:MAG: DUF3368 domain-containing protein [Lentisphaeria bacterium]